VEDIRRDDAGTEVETETIDSLVDRQQLSSLRLVSLTINGAEVEAVAGMTQTIHDHHPTLTIAGWYERDGVKIHGIVVPMLKSHGYQCHVGPHGRVYAWFDE